MGGISKIFLAALVAFHLVVAGAAYASPCKKCCCCGESEAGWQNDCCAGAGVSEPMESCCTVKSGNGAEAATLNSSFTGLLQAQSLALSVTGLLHSHTAFKNESPAPDYGRRAFESPPVYKLTRSYLC